VSWTALSHKFVSRASALHRFDSVLDISIFPRFVGDDPGRFDLHTDRGIVRIESARQYGCIQIDTVDACVSAAAPMPPWTEVSECQTSGSRTMGARVASHDCRWLVVLEETSTGCSAYSPDVPGCVATGNTVDDAEREMAAAIAFHLEGMRCEGLELPAPHSSSLYVDIPA
jgi:predicted RNase H-like HicB family nuclease